jgi:hypothetical protein
VTVAHVATGSRSAGGTTTVAPSYPAGVAAGVLAIAARVLKPQTATGTAETGWKQRISVTGGTGTTGADTGQTRVVVDTKILAGSESGSVTFDNATSPNSSHGVIALYSKSATALWDLSNFSSGSDASHGTGRSASGASALSLKPGDVVLAICGSDTDTATAYTSPAITVAGITFGATTQRLGAGGVTTGNQTGLMIFEATVTSGTASATPTLSLSGGPSNCGPVVFYRLREVEPPAVTGEVNYVDSTTTGDTANTSSRAPAVPAGLAPYDVILVNLSRWASPNSNPAVTLPDAGWVSLGASTSADGDQRNDRYAKRITEEIDFGTYTFSWSGSMWTTAHATMYRGVDRDVDLTTLAGLPDPQSVVATNSGTTFPVLTINNVPEGAALHWHGTSETVSPGHTVPTGWTEVEENDCDVTGYQESVAAGNYTTNASAVGVSSDANPSSMIALPPETTGSTPVGKDLSLLWNTRAALGDTLQAVWNVRAAVGKELGLPWNVRIPVGKEAQALWNVRQAVGKSVQALWNTKAPAGKDLSLLWNTRSIVADSLQLIWNVRTFVGDDLSLLWNTRAAVGDDLQLVWNVVAPLTAVGKDLSLLWNTRQAIGDPLQILWNTRAFVGKTLSLPWDVRAAVGDPLQLVWNTRISVGDLLDLRWNVRQAVGDEVQFLWTTKAAAGKSVQFLWDVQAIGIVAVGKDLSLVWNTKQAVGDTLDLRWNTRITVADSLALAWAVRSLAGDDLTLRWNTKAAVGRNLNVAWDTRAIISDTLDLRWGVRTVVGRSADFLWAVRATAGKSLILVWDTEGTDYEPVTDPQSSIHPNSAVATILVNTNAGNVTTRVIVKLKPNQAEANPQ